MTDEEVKKLFAAYGNIYSLVLIKNEKIAQQFGFVCYDDEKKVNKEYGPACACQAIEKLNGHQFEGSDLKLYVGPAMKKVERDI